MIVGCPNFARYQCNKKLRFSRGWLACGKQLCESHADPDLENNGHCSSSPQTPCQEQYEKSSGKNLKEIFFFSVMMAFVIAIFVFMFVFKMSIRSYKTSLWYVVINSRTGTREYSPLKK